MIKNIILPEYDHEIEITYRVLSKVDWSKKDWKPHQKSMSLGELACHTAEAGKWGLATMTTSGLDMEKSPYVPPSFEILHDLLNDYNDKTLELRHLLEKASDDQYNENWCLQAGEKIYFDMPRISVLRAFVLKHMVHHRGQLSVYLRLLDIPVPSIYGPSADEQV